MLKAFFGSYILGYQLNKLEETTCTSFLVKQSSVVDGLSSSSSLDASHDIRLPLYEIFLAVIT
jgi:hypothetical protein